jgi:hypothetical protein
MEIAIATVAMQMVISFIGVFLQAVGCVLFVLSSRLGAARSSASANRTLKSSPATATMITRAATAAGREQNMTAAIDIAMLSTPAAVTVTFDVSFLMLAVIGASIVVPLVGAVFMGVWCRLLNAPTPRYRSRCAAYFAGYAAALLMATLMMFLVKDSEHVPGWFLASLFGQGIAIHAVVVPLVLKTQWGKQIAAQALTLVLYGAVLVLAMAPVIIHVRRAVDRGEWTAELDGLYQIVTRQKGMDAGKLPQTLDDMEKSGKPLLLLPGHRRGDLVYLGDYIQDNYPSMLGDLFVASMSSIKDRSPEISPLIWRNPKTMRDYRLPVCSYDGSVSFLTRREFDYHLTRTLLELDKIDPDASTNDSEPANDKD